MKFHRTNLHIEDLIEAVFVSYDELLKEKQIEASIEIKCSSTLVYADIDRLKQVFVNLMNNENKTPIIFFLFVFSFCCKRQVYCT